MNICLASWRKDKRPGIFLGVAALLLCTCVLLSLCSGIYNTSPLQVLLILSGYQEDDILYRILVYIRIPRILAAILAGSSLSVSGAIIQGVLDNPLASPNIIGVNAGAGLLVLLVSALLPAGGPWLPLAAFLGALISAFIVLLAGGWSGGNKLAIVLAGTAVSSILGAGMNAILIFYPDAYVGAGNFLTGGLAGLSLKEIAFPAIYIVGGIAVSILFSRQLNVMRLGEGTALTLGMNTTVYRLLLMTLAALLASAAVSFGGLIGFVGLIVPHVVRLLAGNDYRVILPGCALLGSGFVVFSDFIARTLFSPYELPVGILLSVMGGPFFIYLIIRKRVGKYD